MYILIPSCLPHAQNRNPANDWNEHILWCIFSSLSSERKAGQKPMAIKNSLLAKQPLLFVQNIFIELPLQQLAK